MRQGRRHLPSVASLVVCVMLVGWWAVAQAEDGNAANGKKLYLTYCFLCHGTGGKGDGFAAAVQQTKPRDLTNNAYMSARTDEQIFAAISGGGAAFHGSIIMPYWRESLTPKQIWDVVAYIRTLHREPPFHGEAAHGQDLYAQYCWTCHGKTGKGDGPIAEAFGPRPRDLTDQTSLSQRTDYDLYNVISQGGPALDRAPTMPGWGQVLTPQDLWDLVAFLRQLSTK